MPATGDTVPDILAEELPHGFRVTFLWTPPPNLGSNRIIRKPRTITLTTRNMNPKRRDPMNVDAVEEMIFQHCCRRGYRWFAMTSPRELTSEMSTLFRKLSRHPQYAECMAAAATSRTSSRQTKMSDAEKEDRKKKESTELQDMKKSFIAPDTGRKTGATYAVLGPSFSGKTTLLVDGLNRLSREELDAYDAIFFFTESENAEPLEDLNDRVKTKMHIYKCFVPEILAVIKKMNDISGNGFRFLVIFDDITTLRGEAITKMVLTLRNSGISTVLLIQHSKLLNPGQRQSIHHYYIFNLRTEEWLYMLNGFLGTHIREMFPDEIGSGRAQEVAEFLRCYMRDKVIHFDQRTDTLEFISKDSIKK